MNASRSTSALLILLAFLGAQVLHALHPLAHGWAGSCDEGRVELHLEHAPPGAGVVADVDHDADHTLECALCATGLPLATVADAEAGLEAPTLGAPAQGVLATSPARAPPGSFRSRAPPACA